MNEGGNVWFQRLSKSIVFDVLGIKKIIFFLLLSYDFFHYLCSAKMKTWSKYITLIIIIFAIIICKGESISPKENLPDLIEQLTDETECLSTDFQDTYNSSHSFLINSQRSQKKSLRRDNGQRQHLSCVKINYTTKLKSSVVTINKPTHKNSIVSEPANRLIQLGKLII